MNKDSAAQYLPLVQALADGKEIQVKDFGGNWCRCMNPKFDAGVNQYRIKPEPKTAYVIVRGDGTAVRVSFDEAGANTDCAYLNRTAGLGPYTLSTFREELSDV